MATAAAASVSQACLAPAAAVAAQRPVRAPACQRLALRAAAGVPALRASRKARLAPVSLKSPAGLSGSTLMGTAVPATWRKERSTGSNGGAVGAQCSIQLAGSTLQLVLAVASGILLLTGKTSIQKQLLVPFLGLAVPPEVVGWAKSEVGLWIAFAGLLTRIFYVIPGRAFLPLILLLLIVVAPQTVLEFRTTSAANILTLLIAGYIGYDHFQVTNGADGAFKSDNLASTLSVIALIAVPAVTLLKGGTGRPGYF